MLFLKTSRSVKIEILIKHDKICNMYYQIFFVLEIMNYKHGSVLMRNENHD
jgi:hypothetical protein